MPAPSEDAFAFDSEEPTRPTSRDKTHKAKAMRPPAKGFSKPILISLGVGGLTVLLLVTVIAAYFGTRETPGKKGNRPAASGGANQQAKKQLPPAASNNSEYKRGYQIGSDLAMRVVDGNASFLNDHRPAFRESGMKSLKEPKQSTERQYRDLLKTHGPNDDATLLYKGMLDGYVEQVAKDGITLK